MQYFVKVQKKHVLKTNLLFFVCTIDGVMRPKMHLIGSQESNQKLVENSSSDCYICMILVEKLAL